MWGWKSESVDYTRIRICFRAALWTLLLEIWCVVSCKMTRRSHLGLWCHDLSATDESRSHHLFLVLCLPIISFVGPQWLVGWYYPWSPINWFCRWVIVLTFGSFGNYSWESGAEAGVRGSVLRPVGGWVVGQQRAIWYWTLVLEMDRLCTQVMKLLKIFALF